jgi:hypothetical protein
VFAGPTPFVSTQADDPAAGSVEVRTFPSPSVAAQKLAEGQEIDPSDWPGSSPTALCQAEEPPVGSVVVRTSFDIGPPEETAPTMTQKLDEGHETAAGTPSGVPDAATGCGELHDNVAAETAFAPRALGLLARSRRPPRGRAVVFRRLRTPV